MLAVLSVVGFSLYFYDLIPDQQTSVFSQMAFRLAIVLGTVWLAFAQVEELFTSYSSSALIVALLAVFVVSRLPLVLISVVVILLVIAISKYVKRFFLNG